MRIANQVLKEDKAEYIQALIDAREEGEIEIFCECMASLHNRHLQYDIDAFLSSIEDGGQKTNNNGGQENTKVDRRGGQNTRAAILQLIHADAKITSTKMATALGINRSAVSKHLKKLQDDGVIRRVGPDKGGYWEIISKEDNL